MTNWVIKIGSSLLTDVNEGLNEQAIRHWAKQISQIKQSGIHPVLVSSGAIAEGVARLKLKQRPKTVHQLQACAAIGQMGLVQAYEHEFKKYGYLTAQILLTHDDLANRQRYLNARSAIMTLIEMSVLPIINENDTVITDEIRFGDNDTLAALVANLVSAERLIILTDQDGLFDKNPRQHADAQLIRQAQAGDQSLLAMASGPSSLMGSGGMLTKLTAAQKAARSGTQTFIVNGRKGNVLIDLLNGENPGTQLIASESKIAAKKQWLAGQLKAKGHIVIDDGAVSILTQHGKSLLPVGVKSVNGVFMRGELVQCLNTQGQVIASGLVNYSSTETLKIMGQASSLIEAILGYVNESELIHRDNLFIL